MWTRFLIVLVISVGCVFSEDAWLSKARIPDPSGYFSKIVQEMIYDVEKMEWCNLKLDDYSQILNDHLYHWHVNGTVAYSNGFVVSIQAMDVTNMEQLITTRPVDNVNTPFATIRGRLNMRDIAIGYDVIVDLADQPEQRYTGRYTHLLVQIQLDVTKNLFSGEITSSPYTVNVSGESGRRMVYMPANNVTEALSRRYIPGDNWNGVTGWSEKIFGPMLVDIASNRIKFPDICFVNCPA